MANSDSLVARPMDGLAVFTRDGMPWYTIWVQINFQVANSHSIKRSNNQPIEEYRNDEGVCKVQTCFVYVMVADGIMHVNELIDVFVATPPNPCRAEAIPLSGARFAHSMRGGDAV